MTDARTKRLQYNLTAANIWSSALTHSHQPSSLLSTSACSMPGTLGLGGCGEVRSVLESARTGKVLVIRSASARAQAPTSGPHHVTSAPLVGKRQALGADDEARQDARGCREAASFTCQYAVLTYTALGRRLNAFVVASARADGGRPSRQEERGTDSLSARGALRGPIRVVELR